MKFNMTNAIYFHGETSEFITRNNMSRYMAAKRRDNMAQLILKNVYKRYDTQKTKCFKKKQNDFAVKRMSLMNVKTESSSEY